MDLSKGRSETKGIDSPKDSQWDTWGCSRCERYICFLEKLTLDLCHLCTPGLVCFPVFAPAFLICVLISTFRFIYSRWLLFLFLVPPFLLSAPPWLFSLLLESHLCFVCNGTWTGHYIVTFYSVCGLKANETRGLIHTHTPSYSSWATGFSVMWHMYLSLWK